MKRTYRAPWPAMVIALLATFLMIGVKFTPMAVVLVGGLWLLSLVVEWARPLPVEPPAPPQPRVDPDALVLLGIRATVGAMGLPLVLLEGTRIIAANAAARSALGEHIVDQDARVALRHPEAVRLLDLPDGTDSTIRGLTGAGSLWRLSRRRIDSRYWAIELTNRTAEAVIGRAHTDFVANASHELRTPLSSIIGYVETLADADGKMEADTRARFLAVVLREARRMQSLVADLMSLSQLEAEKYDVPTHRIDLGHLAARVVGEFPAATSGLTAGEDETRAPRLSLDKVAAPVTVAGDVKQLEQLLRNLIDNALKYGDDDKPVVVDLTVPSPGMARVTVTDHGPGIAPEHLPHLTRRFYRTDPGRSRAAGGTGLGLAIVKHIVERHRGRLDIASTKGTGTVVTVQLPIASEPA